MRGQYIIHHSSPLSPHLDTGRDSSPSPQTGMKRHNFRYPSFLPCTHNPHTHPQPAQALTHTHTHNRHTHTHLHKHPHARTQQAFQRDHAGVLQLADMDSMHAHQKNQILVVKEKIERWKGTKGGKELAVVVSANDDGGANAEQKTDDGGDDEVDRSKVGCEWSGVE